MLLNYLNRTRKGFISSLKANTLLETVVAITIIITVTLITASIIILMDKNSNPILQFRAAVSVVNELNYEKSDLIVYRKNNDSNQLIKESNIYDSDIDEGLKIINIIVYDNNKHKLVELKEIVSR